MVIVAESFWEVNLIAIIYWVEKIATNCAEIFKTNVYYRKQSILIFHTPRNSKSVNGYILSKTFSTKLIYGLIENISQHLINLLFYAYSICSSSNKYFDLQNNHAKFFVLDENVWIWMVNGEWFEWWTAANLSVVRTEWPLFQQILFILPRCNKGSNTFIFPIHSLKRRRNERPLLISLHRVCACAVISVRYFLEVFVDSLLF